MTAPAALTVVERRGSELLQPQTRRVQLVYAGVVTLVLIVLSVVDVTVWEDPWLWLAAAGFAGATAVALLGHLLPMSAARVSIAVPLLDLLAMTVLLGDGQAPRNLAMLAVVPACWLGIVGRARGIVLVGALGVAIAVTMALKVPITTGTAQTANLVGTVLVPVVLIAAAWFAHHLTRTLERQQLGIVRREREKTALARKAAEDATMLDAIFETARVGLLLLGPDGRIVRANPTLRTHPALAGTAGGGLLDGARFLELESRRPLPALDTPLVRAARGESFDNAVFWIHRPGHEMFAASMSSRPLLLDGEFRGSIASIDDVTPYMRMLEDRDDFVALVSHELRTPLTSIAGYLELALDEDGMRPELESWLQTVQRNANRLRALVEDLLLVGELTRGQMHLQPESVDLRTLAAEAISQLDHRARKRQVTITLTDGPAVVLHSDRRRMRQVIENLLSNAVKYTRDAGRVEIEVGVEGADAVVRVTDDGPGMLPTEAARVFERFYRSASARASGVAGAGLGLWICRSIVQAHGGTIGFTSELGAGSVASFRLPLAG